MSRQYVVLIINFGSGGIFIIASVFFLMVEKIIEICDL